jgi:hypothetical protein
MMNEMIPYQEIKLMASAMSFGRMFGKTAEELLPLMILAQAEGKHPAIAAMEYDVIQGKPAINSRAALARFQSAGGKIQWQKRDDTEAIATFAHPQGGELTISWTIKRAAQAGLTGKDTWRKYPAQMLSSRVVAEGVRAVFPACLSGMYTTEEVQDFTPPQKHETIKPAEDQAIVEPQTLSVDPRSAIIKALKDAINPPDTTWTGLKKMYHGDFDGLIKELERMKNKGTIWDEKVPEPEQAMDSEPPLWDGQK